MADYRILLEADTAKAEKDLKRVETVADTATRTRKLRIEIPDISRVHKGFENLKGSIEGASNNIRSFYDISKIIPGIGDKVQNVEDAFKNTKTAISDAFGVIDRNATAGGLLSNLFQKASSGANSLLNALGKIGLALYGLQQIAGVVQGAFGKLFSETIGREIQLRETLLKTQTTVASMSDVFVRGRQIIDPLEKIKALTKSVEKNVDNIRERSLDLAGVTSSDVVEVFGIVASQIGQVGGGLKDAEDLAISFAAALGTFQIPLQQARQEITSMLQGNIGADSYLARALGITNADIQRARTQAGGVIEFIQKKLETAVAGQKLAAQSFSGVLSNIRELGELIGQKLGRGLLDPMLAGLTRVYTLLSSVKDQMYAIAEGAGAALGVIARMADVRFTRVFLPFNEKQISEQLTRIANQAQSVATGIFSEMQRIAYSVVSSLIQVVDALRPAILSSADAIRTLIKGFAEIQVGKFQALVSALANIVTAVSPAINVIAGLVNAWSKFLDLPILQYVSEVAAVLGLLKRMGLDAALSIVAFANFLLTTGVPAIAKIGLAVGGFIVTLGLLVAAIGKVALSIAALAGAFLTPAAAIPALQAGLLQFIASLRAAGATAAGAGGQIRALGATMQAAGASAKSMALSLLSSLGKFALIQIGIAVLVDLFGRYQRAQEEAAKKRELIEAIAFLEKNAKGAAGGLDAVTQAQYDYNRALLDGAKTDVVKQIRNTEKAIAEQSKGLSAGKKGWDLFFHTLQYGGGGIQDEIIKKVAALKGQKEELRKELERVIKAIQAESDTQAKAYANSPKGQVEQKMKELKVTEEQLKLDQQIAQNAIARQQLNGQLNTDAVRQVELAQQLNGITTELATKQKLLDTLLGDPKLAAASTDEIRKLKGEVAQLEGKQINLQIQVKREQFDQAVKSLEAATSRAQGALDIQSNQLSLQNKLVQARAQAETTINSTLISQARHQLENAKTQGERAEAASRIYALEVANAKIQYQAALSNINMEVQRQALALRSVELKYEELQAVVRLAKAQGLVTREHYLALEAQGRAVRLAANNYEYSGLVAKEQIRGAEATYKAAVNAAKIAYQSNIAAQNTRNMADNTRNMADNAERYTKAMRGPSVNIRRPKLEPWQEALIAKAKQGAISGTLGSNSFKSYINGISAELRLASYFNKINEQNRQAEYAQQQQDYEAKYGPIPGFATGGIVTRPTLAMIGEGGETEYIIPESKMAATSAAYLSRYSGTEGVSSPNINISTGPVLEFNGERYVTISDFERGLQQMASSVYQGLRTPAGRYAMGIR